MQKKFVPNLTGAHGVPKRAKKICAVSHATTYSSRSYTTSTQVSTINEEFQMKLLTSTMTSLTTSMISKPLSSTQHFAHSSNINISVYDIPTDLTDKKELNKIGNSSLKFKTAHLSVENETKLFTEAQTETVTSLSITYSQPTSMMKCPVSVLVVGIIIIVIIIGIVIVVWWKKFYRVSFTCVGIYFHRFLYLFHI